MSRIILVMPAAMEKMPRAKTKSNVIFLPSSMFSCRMGTMGSTRMRMSMITSESDMAAWILKLAAQCVA